MSDRHVIVHRSYDSIQAEQLGELLRDAGIGARVLGTRFGAQIGVGSHAIEVAIEVPEAQAGEATDILEDYFSTDGAALLAEQFGPDDDDELVAAATDAPLRRLLAAGSSLLLGLGHVYSRRYYTAALLVATQVWAIAYSAQVAAWRELMLVLVVLCAVRLFDLVGAILAVGAHNAGVRRGAGAQLAIGGAMVAAAVTAGALLGPRIPQPELAEDGARFERRAR